MISISSQQAAPPTTMDHTIQPAIMKKPAKSQQPAPTKIRRTRQARNPQLSVARRNERERNRVKMVNNGFALLRQHLPVEHLQHQASLYGDCDSGSDTPSTNFDSNKCPTPAGAASSSKAKKFSKVETLRAAIQHIKMLEELMRSDEPNFESMNIDPQGNSTSASGSGLIQQQQQQQQRCIGYDETDNSAQMIEAASPSFNQTSPAMHTYLQPLPDQHQTFVRLSMDSSPMQPQQHQQPQQSLVPSPPNSQISQSSCNSNSSVTGSSLNQPAFITSQSHSHHQFSGPSDSHTHLWLEQHHNSFVQQQQQQQQQHYSEQQWYQTQVDQQVEQANGNWQQQQQHPQPHSPVDCESAQSPLVWYSNSTLSPPEVGSSESDAPTPMRIKCEPSSASNLSSIKQQQQQQPIHYTTSAEYIHHASHHLQAAAHQQQVSLYSQ